MENIIQTIAIYAIPVIFAITLHEAAHGYVARYFGDTTAARLGRISLNPTKHIDPFGTIILPLITLAAMKIYGLGVPFGWAKPVPVIYSNLRNPKRDMLWVAAAGPFANLLMAFGWALLYKLTTLAPNNEFSLPMALIADAGISVNVMLMVLNLLPILPLDGGRIAMSLLPDRLAYSYSRMEPYGLVVLLLLIVTNPYTNFLNIVLGPMVQTSIEFIDGIFQL